MPLAKTHEIVRGVVRLPKRERIRAPVAVEREIAVHASGAGHGRAAAGVRSAAGAEMQRVERTRLERHPLGAPGGLVVAVAADAQDVIGRRGGVGGPLAGTLGQAPAGHAAGGTVLKAGIRQKILGAGRAGQSQEPEAEESWHNDVTLRRRENRRNPVAAFCRKPLQIGWRQGPIRRMTLACATRKLIRRCSNPTARTSRS